MRTSRRTIGISPPRLQGRRRLQPRSFSSGKSAIVANSSIGISSPLSSQNLCTRRSVPGEAALRNCSRAPGGSLSKSFRDQASPQQIRSRKGCTSLVSDTTLITAAFPNAGYVSLAFDYRGFGGRFWPKAPYNSTSSIQTSDCSLCEGWGDKGLRPLVLAKPFAAIYSRAAQLYTRLTFSPRTWRRACSGIFVVSFSSSLM